MSGIFIIGGDSQWDPSDEADLKAQQPQKATLYSFTAHIGAPAIKNNWAWIEHKLMPYMGKGVLPVEEMISPCPACPEWQITLEYDTMQDMVKQLPKHMRMFEKIVNTSKGRKRKAKGESTK